MILKFELSLFFLATLAIYIADSLAEGKRRRQLVGKSEDEIWRVISKRILLRIPVFFFVYEVGDVWRRVIFTGAPFGWNVILAAAALNILFTPLGITIALLYLKSVVKHRYSRAPRAG